MTSSHPEERRIAGLLRELIARSGMPFAQIEESLGWEPGRLEEALSEPGRMMIGEILVLLPVLRTSIGEFFARFDGLEVRPPASAQVEESEGRDTRFDESRRVIEGAIARRFAWKSERA